MATGKITIDEGSTTNLATNQITEDAVIKQIGRSVLNSSDGAEFGTIANPVIVNGSNVTQPISGTVTANLGTIADVATQTTLSTLNGKVVTCNTGSVTISSAIPTGTNAIGKLAANSGVDIGDVDILSLPSVSLASQINPFTNDINISLDSEAVLLGAGDSNIGNVDVVTLPNVTLASQVSPFSTDVKISLDSEAVVLGAGSELIGSIEISGAIPAGTNSIGKLGANSGVDIGDVDVTSLPAIPAGTNLIGAVKRDTINYTPVRKYYEATGAATDGIVWSPAAGKKWAITDISLSTSAAATVTFEDDKAAGDAIVMGWDLAANGGVTINLQTPLVSEEADADLIVTTSAGNIKCVVSGYEI
jgi:hypothetical protein